MTSVVVTTAAASVVVTEGGSSTVVTAPRVTQSVAVITEGPQGPKGDAGAGYIYTQQSPASTWTINHLLGFKPSVDIYDSGSQQIAADVSHPSLNQSVILFTAPTAGFARLT
jgi:hypothetical protein